MKNLIIIGNGFDKAHNLKTTYNEFIENLINRYFTNVDKYSNILSSIPYNITNYDELIKSIAGRVPDFTSQVHGKANFKNFFIGSLLYNLAVHNWCDIEYQYFTELIKSTEIDNSKRLYANPKKLNDDFEVIKKYLSEYLIEEEKQAKKIVSYRNLFQQFANSNNALILNFNYTRTIDNLYSDIISCPKIYIHGKLEDETNPIIFGYAAKNDESRKLHGYNNNEYLKNIKKYLYNRTNNKTKLNKFLGQNEKHYNDYEKIDVFIFGHSCGLSDNLILKEIFNHDAIYSIKAFYYENYENYSDVQINTDRIMDDDVRFKKFITFKNSHRMPQWNDNEAQTQKFIKYIKEVENNYPTRPYDPTRF